MKNTKIFIALLSASVLFVLFQNFTPVVNHSNKKAEFYRKGNNIIGYICSNSYTPVVKVTKNGSTHVIQPSYKIRNTSTSQAFSNQFRYLKKVCGTPNNLAFFSSTLPTQYTSGNVSFKMSTQSNSWNINFTPIGLPKDQDKAVGILYSTFHCPVAHFHNNGERVFDMTEILKKADPNSRAWGPVNWHHWTGKPWNGYYCLTNSSGIINKHAALIASAGIDYIMIDSSNWPQAYESNNINELRRDFKEKVADPVMAIITKYKSLKEDNFHVPQIVMFAAITEDRASDWNINYNESLARWLKEEFLPEAGDLAYKRKNQNKPLLFVKVSNTASPFRPYKWSRVTLL